MKITRESILGIGNDSSLVNLDWLREKKPDTNEEIKKQIDSVEFEINHEGIEKLEKNIQDDTEYIMCFVHFDAGTEELDGIYFSIWGGDSYLDNKIDSSILDEEEKKVIIEYALEELRNCR